MIYLIHTFLVPSTYQVHYSVRSRELGVVFLVNKLSVRYRNTWRQCVFSFAFFARCQFFVNCTLLITTKPQHLIQVPKLCCFKARPCACILFRFQCVYTFPYVGIGTSFSSKFLCSLHCLIHLVFFYKIFNPFRLL